MLEDFSCNTSGPIARPPNKPLSTGLKEFQEMELSRPRQKQIGAQVPVEFLQAGQEKIQTARSIQAVHNAGLKK